jgi:hypothetical protein
LGDQLQVVFMPWAGLAKSVSLGAVTFWPWESEAEQRVRDAGVRAHLDRLFGLHRTEQGCRVDAITVCSHRRVRDFQPLTKWQEGEVRRERDALFLAASAGRRAGGGFALGPPTADVFKLSWVGFKAGQDRISIESRSRCALWDNMDRVSIARPFSLGGGPSEPDPELARGLGKAMCGKAPARVRHGLFGALDWFRLAHIEEGDVSDLSRVVMMATAFETLLDAHNKRKLAQKVDGHLRELGFRRSRRMYREGNTRKWLSCTAAGGWLWDFYDVRSKTVHGDRVSVGKLRYTKKISHLSVADKAFRTLVKVILFQHGCMWASTLRSAAGYASGPEEAWRLAMHLPSVRWGLLSEVQDLDWASDSRDPQ